MAPGALEGRVVVFPGQGSQRPGMGVDWRRSPAWQRWEEAEHLLGRPLAWLALEADPEQLRDPLHCQLALFVHHAVLWDTWRAEHPGPVAAVAGHSLGEYNALVAAGVLDFATGLRLVEVRASAVRAAAEREPGGMLACIGVADDVLADAVADSGAWISNDNAPGQMVVSGAPQALDRLTAALAGHGRVVRLDVGGAYHSPAMQHAVAPLRNALTAASFSDPICPVVANVDATPHHSGPDWPPLLTAQLTAPVRWRATVERLVAMGASEQVELGASPVLTGLAKRIAPGLRRRFVGQPDDLRVAA